MSAVGVALLELSAFSSGGNCAGIASGGSYFGFSDFTMFGGGGGGGIDIYVPMGGGGGSPPSGFVVDYFRLLFSAFVCFARSFCCRLASFCSC